MAAPLMPEEQKNLKAEDRSQQPFKRQGSIRKVLPSFRDGDTQLSMSAKIIDRRTTTPRESACYGPYFLEYSMLAEFKLLASKCLPGVYVIPSAMSPLRWFGVLFIQQGLYQGGVFRFTLHIPNDYPEGQCPKFVFNCPVFHPLVNAETGELDVVRGFKKWRKNVNYLWHILVYAQKVFSKIEITFPSNLEAAALFENDADLFCHKVTESISKCYANALEGPRVDDPHAIWFPELDQGARIEVIRKMITPKREYSDSSRGEQVTGLSWIKKGSLQIFSNNDNS